MVGPQPVLIDFERSIFGREAYISGRISAPPGGTDPTPTLWRRIKRILGRTLSGENSTARRMAARFLAEAKSRAQHPRICVIGGGTISSGAEALYQDPDVMLVGTDVFASTMTVVVADGHHLPFADESFDGVWIQAVLEHVLAPDQVVAEIHRVLKRNGTVYAETPFMQQVHMGAFDFSRFTMNGHRWLFRHFEQLDGGIVGGAGVATIWSIRYLARSLGAGATLATVIAAPFFWLRFLDRIGKPGPKADAASGFYFLGRKSQNSMTPKDMPAYYKTGCDGK